MNKIPASPLDCFQLLLGDAENCFLMSLCLEFSGRADVEKLRASVEKLHEDFPMLKYFYEGDERGGVFSKKKSRIYFLETDESPDIIRSKMFPYTEKLFRVVLSHGENLDALIILIPHLLTDARGMIQLTSAIGKYYQGKTLEKNSVANDRTLHEAFKNFSEENLSKLFEMELARHPEIFSNKKYFEPQETFGEAKFLQKKISAENFSMLKKFAKDNSASIHDLLVTAYAYALQSYAEKFFKTHLTKVPLCSTSDLRRYFPKDKQDKIMNYSVAYWSPIVMGEDFSESLKNFSEMTKEMKQNSLGVGAGRNFYKETLILDEMGEGFAGVPFLSNIGVVPSNDLYFGEELSVSGVWAFTRVPGRDPFSLGALTFLDELHLMMYGDEVSERIMDEMIGRLESLGG